MLSPAPGKTTRTRYEFQTSVGPFHIVKHQSRYHAVYAGIIICSCYRAEEIAAVLGYGYKFSFLGSGLGEIDTTNLRIPTDLSDWTSCYSMHEDISGKFTPNPH